MAQVAGRVPAQQVHNPEFKPQYHKNKQLKFQVILTKSKGNMK
jgi:hypothetical protein